MITIHVSYGNDETQKWETIHSVDLIPSSELYADDTLNDDSYGVNDSEFCLPNGEIFQIGATYTPSNMGMMLVILKEEQQLINLTCYKKNLEHADPALVFLTPGGIDVSVMVTKSS